MNQLNSIILEGNVNKKPKNDFNMVTLTLDVTRVYRNEKGETVTETSSFPVEAWGRLGEFLQSQYEKGRGMRVVGRLKQHRWKTDDGKNMSKVIVVAEHIEFKPMIKKEEA